MNALTGLAILLVLQAVGEAAAHALGLPLPGPVVGTVLLIAALQCRRLQEPVRAAAEALLSNLSLLFIPAGVGVITHLDLLSRYGVRLLLVIVASTWIGMAVTAWLLNRWLSAASREGAEP